MPLGDCADTPDHMRGFIYAHPHGSSLKSKDGSGSGFGADIREFRVRGFRFRGLIFAHGFSGSDTQNAAGLVRIFNPTRGSPLGPERFDPTSSLWGVQPRVPTAKDMGRITRDGPAHKMKTCGARHCSAHAARHPGDTLKIA